MHARGQVAHLDLPSAAWSAGGFDAWPADVSPARPAEGRNPWSQARPCAVRRLAGLLPPDVRVRAIGAAPDGFDARFSALWRRYSYRICDDPVAADPLRRHDTLWYPRPVDIARMNDAARSCLGEHDFAVFCRRREGATTVRELLRLEWARTASGTAVATVAADAFCHNMVRALVGALLAVGDGRRPAWLAEVLAAGTRDPAVHVVAPHGLCLEEVRYPPDTDLAARAEFTRRVRPALPRPLACPRRPPRPARARPAPPAPPAPAPRPAPRPRPAPPRSPCAARLTATARQPARQGFPADRGRHLRSTSCPTTSPRPACPARAPPPPPPPPTPAWPPPPPRAGYAA